MPLQRLFHSDKRSRRSGSSHSNGNLATRNELSTVSWDDSELRASPSPSNGDLARTAVACLSAPLTTYPVQWNSASCLTNNEDRTRMSAKFLQDHSSYSPALMAVVSPTPSRARAQFSGWSSKSEQEGRRSRIQHSSVRKKLSNFEDISRLEFAADGYRLTGQQRDLLKSCWNQAKSRQGEPGKFVFKWVFARYPEMKKLFSADSIESEKEGSNLNKHTEAFSSVLELVVSSVLGESGGAPSVGPSTTGISLDDTTGPLLHSYGARHAQMEINRGHDDEEDLIQPEHWDIFKMAMCEYASSAWRQNVLAALGSSAQKRNEALHAWRILVYYIIAKIKRGYEMEKNEHKKRGRGRSVAE